MRIRSTLPALALLAAVGPWADLRAQQFTLPPAPNSAADKQFSAEFGPCFYNPYAWSSRALLNNSLLGAEMQDLVRSTQNGRSCASYALTSFDFVGPWGYMLSDGIPVPHPASQEEVKAAKQASLAALEGEQAAVPVQPPAGDERASEDRIPGAPRTGHAAVPPLGKGYGSSELVSRRLVLRAAPESKPTMYDGVPIVERGRSWERIQTADGRRVWLETRPVDPAVRRPGAGSFGPAGARSAAGRSSRSPQGAGATFPSSRFPGAVRSTPAPSVSRSPGALRSPQGGKKTARE